MNIREFRKHEDMSQTELASQLGVTQGAVGQWERGDSYPSGPTAAKLIRLSGGLITLDEIYPIPAEEKAAA